MSERPARRVMLRRIALPNVWQTLQHHAFAFTREVDACGPTKILAVYRREPDGGLSTLCPCEAVPDPSRLTFEFGELMPTKRGPARVSQWLRRN